MPDEPRAVTIRFQLSKSDVYRALVWNAFRRPWIAALIVVMGVRYMLFALMGTAEHREMLLCAGVVLILLGVFRLLGTPYIRTRTTMSSPTFQGPLEYTFSDAGIFSKGMYSSSQSEWVLIKRVSESSRFIFVWRFQNLVHLIPKSQVSAPDLAALKSILRACVKGNVRLKP